MSQSHNPTDSQALLQSMLQRLKIQPGRDSQTYLHTPVPITGVNTCVQDGERGASNTHSPVNGFQFGTYGVPSKGFGISAEDTNCSLKDGKIQQPGLGCKVDRGLITFPIQKSNTDGDKVENSVVVRATHPGISPIGTEQLFPAKSLKDADVTSSERTSVGRVTNDKGAVRGMAKNQDQDQSFTPKVHVWSLEPTNANADMVSQERRVVHMENGGFGALTQSKETHITPNDQITTKSNSRRKQQSSENKTRRWAQKFKERWKDRQGSFGKKTKEEQREEQQSEQGTKIAPQNQLLTVETPINTPNKKEDTSDSSKTHLTCAEGGANQGITRSTIDFEFGLGSFSLLEEISTGQEWATFLKPNQSATLANQRLSVKPKPHDCSQPSLIVKHKGDLKKKLASKGTEALPVSDFGMAQISPDEFMSVSMDVSEGKQQQYADQSEPMEHGHAPSDIQSVDSGVGQDLRLPSCAQPANILNNLALKGRVHLNRKRQHQSAERRGMRLQTEKRCDGNETDGEGSVSPLSPRSSDVMKTRVQSEHDDVMPLYTLNSPPVSPSSALPRKGVLRHSISQDSESSVVIVTKRRRVEENRRVRFSEDVVAIMPPDLDLSSTESEEDSGAEGYSTTEGEQEVKEEVPPARRPALPAWILALKRRNTGRKHRK